MHNNSGDLDMISNEYDVVKEYYDIHKVYLNYLKQKSKCYWIRVRVYNKGKC